MSSGCDVNYVIRLYPTFMLHKTVDVFGNHGLGGLLEEGAHEKSPKCLDGNLGDFCKGLLLFQKSFRNNKLINCF